MSHNSFEEAIAQIEGGYYKRLIEIIDEQDRGAVVPIGKREFMMAYNAACMIIYDYDRWPALFAYYQSKMNEYIDTYILPVLQPSYRELTEYQFIKQVIASWKRYSFLTYHLARAFALIEKCSEFVRLYSLGTYS
jgi:hypothetical protein